MATLGPPSFSPSASPPFHRRRKSWARRIERCCCSTLSYFPLVFVYGLTTWAVFVEVRVSFLDASSWSACTKAVIGVLLYGLANTSYTIAVFTSPGSPLDPRQDWSVSTSNANGHPGRRKGGYDVLPTYDHDRAAPSHPSAPTDMTTVTAKASTGRSRYCKKCHTLKPDRTHHCSTCGRCVLKMDHHCPWLATCVGLRNYKPFLLFLTYLSLFCWLCFGITASWVWAAITDDLRMREGYLVVNTIMLAVLSGIVGLVLSGFTAWHGYLVTKGETTIESLEKTRYLAPLRKSMAPAPQQQQKHIGERHALGDTGALEDDGRDEAEMGLLEQLKETHANALPGILRPEEGETSRSRAVTPPAVPAAMHGSGSSPAADSLQLNFAALEARREHERYSSYLDEQESEKLPNAFDLGWKRNLGHVFGSRPLLWFLPICNTSGDGWVWDVSPKWTEARVAQAREREARAREDLALREMDSQSLQAGNGNGRFDGPSRDYRWTPGHGFVDRAPPPPASHPSRPGNGHSAEGTHMQMQPLDRRKAPLAPPLTTSDHGRADYYDGYNDEELYHAQTQRTWDNGTGGAGMANWNDIPDDFLPSRANGSASESRNHSRGRRKGD